MTMNNWCLCFLVLGEFSYHMNCHRNRKYFGWYYVPYEMDDDHLGESCIQLSFVNYITNETVIDRMMLLIESWFRGFLWAFPNILKKNRIKIYYKLYGTYYLDIILSTHVIIRVLWINTSQYVFALDKSFNDELYELLTEWFRIIRGNGNNRRCPSK